MRQLAHTIFLGLSLFASNTAQAGSLTFFDTRAAFDAAEPGLPVQSFDTANLSGQPYVTIPSPLSGTTNDGVFKPGDILPGLKISTRHPGSKSTALIVYAGGPVGATSVGNNWFGDTLVLKFTPPVSAVGQDVFGNTSSGPSFAGKINEQVFAGTKSLGSKTVTEAAGGSAFIGVSSATANITSVCLTWASDGDATSYASTIAFGTPAAAR